MDLQPTRRILAHERAEQLNDLLTTADVARMLGIAPVSVRAAAKSAGITRKFAGRRVFTHEDVELLRQRRRPGRPVEPAPVGEE